MARSVEMTPHPTDQTIDAMPTKLKKKIQSTFIMMIGVRYVPAMIPPYIKLIDNPESNVFSLSRLSTVQKELFIITRNGTPYPYRCSIFPIKLFLLEISTLEESPELRSMSFQNIYKISHFPKIFQCRGPLIPAWL